MKDKNKSHSDLRNTKSGSLYIVATPIGNLEDITLRALKILKRVNLIAAESVQHAKGLLQYHGIKTRLTRYNQHNRKVKGPELVKKLKSGYDIALITNAGTPGVSDPGLTLISRALEEEIGVSPIPGPSAVTAAVSVSGLPGDKFLFLGFLPNRSGKRKKALRNLANETGTVVFFEAPHRIQDMLMDLKDILGDRRIVAVREQTKLHEEVIRGSVTDVLEHLKGGKIRGEFTLVMAGTMKNEEAPSLDEMTRKRIEKMLMERKMSIKDIAAELSVKTGMAYRFVYRECLSIKRGVMTLEND
jgi:16S rRNA (cytidine1402-2'-O)-methyltransferase